MADGHARSIQHGGEVAPLRLTVLPHRHHCRCAIHSITWSAATSKPIDRDRTPHQNHCRSAQPMSLLGQNRTNHPRPKFDFVCFGPIADKRGGGFFAKGERASARPRAHLRRVAAFDRKVAACAFGTTATDLHHPVAAAAGRYRRGNGLAPAEHHVRAVPRQLHPYAPRTFLGLASDRDILGNGARRPAMPHEARMIETVAASHIVSMMLSERVERGTIRMAQAGAGSAEQQCEPKADDTKRHDTKLAFQRAQSTSDAPNLWATAITFLPSRQCQQCSRW